MYDEGLYELKIAVLNEDGDTVLEHTSHGHKEPGACTAYAHALKALMKHYEEKRVHEEAIYAARAEASEKGTEHPA